MLPVIRAWLMLARVVVNCGSYADVCADRMFWCNCARRESIVVAKAIPTLPPMLRARFTRPEASLFLPGGRYAYAIVLIGTNRNAIPDAWMIRAHTAWRKLICRSKLPMISSP